MPPKHTSIVTPRMQDTVDQDCDGFTSSLLSGLMAKKKSIPSRFFYDARGSALFDQITEQPEYYLTRCETEILQTYGDEISDALRDVRCIVEFGSGSSLKTEILLRKLPELASYLAIDVSSSALHQAKDRLSKTFPHLEITTCVTDFTQPMRLPEALARVPRSGFFPGSTVGNFAPNQAAHLLKTFAQTLQKSAHLVIGVDLKKPEHLLKSAYNDAKGVTADFNLNLLVRANRESNANFNLNLFRHRAAYNPETGGVDMYLVSTTDQSVKINGHQIAFAAGEVIHTEHSHKYSLDEFEMVANASGWRVQKVWSDPDKLFAVIDLVSCQETSQRNSTSSAIE